MLLLCGTPSLAQDVPPAPLLPPAATLAETEIALGEEAARLTVPVQIGTGGPYAFIIDTGAERTVVSRELATALGLAPGPPVRMTAMTGASIVKTVIIPALTLSPLGGRRIESPVLEAHNLGALGMLGIDALQGQILAIDFAHDRMTIRPSTKRDRNNIAAGDIVVRARNLLGQLVVTDARFRGKRVRVVIDTGAVVSIGNRALRTQVGGLGKAQRIALRSVTGVGFEADYTQLAQFELGGLTFANLPVAFYDAAPFARFGLSDQPALLLGIDALRLFRRVEIDFANREVRFLGARTAP